jgi:nicotinamidase-related amidase
MSVENLPDGRWALLLVDLQEGLCKEGPECLAPALAEQVARRGILSAAAKLQRVALEEESLVIHVRLAFDPNYLTRTNRTKRFQRYPDEQLLRSDAPAARIMPELASSEIGILTKGCVNPYIGTPLAAILASHHVTGVVIAGVATTLAVESAARHSADSGLATVVVEDACASFTPELHDFAIANTLPLFADVISTAEAQTVLRSASVRV